MKRIFISLVIAVSISFQAQASVSFALRVAAKGFHAVAKTFRSSGKYANRFSRQAGRIESKALKKAKPYTALMVRHVSNNGQAYRLGLVAGSAGIYAGGASIFSCKPMQEVWQERFILNYA